MQAVATPYFLLIWRPARTSSSVIVGWSREWSIIFARSSRETEIVFGRAAMIDYLRLERRILKLKVFG